MAEQVGGMILEKMVEKLVDPIIRQFSYMLCYKNNIKTLADKIQDIQNTKTGVTLLVDEAKRNLQIIGPDVEAWLKMVEDNGKMADEILQGTNKVTNGCLNGWCPNLKQRYLLSRKAVKQTVIIKELQNEGEKHTMLSYPALPTSMVVHSWTAGSEVFESRVSKTKEVIEALKDNSVTKIGICGLGGIGKTKMAKDVRDRVKVENLFDEVAMAVVSQYLDLKNIQDQLANQLGLDLKVNDSIDDRGRKLYQRLGQGKSVLVILDDLWEELDLNKIGIPVGGQGHSMGCKVLITSREEHVCVAMDTDKNFTIQMLFEKEAWELFKQKAGNCVVNDDLHQIAEDVLKECGGLPLAIVTVAAALKGWGKHSWMDALQQLKTSSATSIQGIDAKLYSSLRLSYDYLKRKYNGTKENECNQHQRLFLLCCLFPEDCDISVELLFRFATGLGFINNQDLEFARSHVQTLTDQLRSCYLLLPSDKDGHVKMHDVVRDFGLREASGVYFSRHDGQLKEWPLNDEVERHIAISIESEKEVKLPLGLNCPLLQLLQLSGPGSIQISKDYFGAMKELRVIFLENKSISFHHENMLLKSSPKALEFFMNVQTLCLESCHFEIDICFIGYLQKLKILSFYDCKIDVLPSEIGRLSNLKLLDLRGCKLGSTVPGVLSCLTKLEDLYTGEYFHVKEDEECNREKRASITELYSLSGLKTLQVSVPNQEVFLKLKDFSFQVLKRFDITTSYYCSGRHEFLGELKLEEVNLNFIQETMFAGVLRKAEVIALRKVYGRKSIMKEADKDCFMKLKELCIEYNEDMVEICEGNLPPGSMGMLEELELRYLRAMRRMWGERVRPPSLVNLKVIVIANCNEIVNMFSPSAARCLVQLQQLKVIECNKLDEIVSKDGWEYESQKNMIGFPKLKEMRLFNLPSFKSLVAVGYNNSRSESIFNEVLLPSMEELLLIGVDVVKLVDGKTNPAASFNKLHTLKLAFCNSMEVVFDLEGVDVLNENGAKVIVFSQLHTIKIEYLPELKHIWKNGPKEILQNFQNLKTLELWNCEKIEYVLSASMAKLLVNLQEIELVSCNSMEVVFDLEGVDVLNENGAKVILFSQLHKIYIYNLPELKHIWKNGPKEIRLQAGSFRNLKTLHLIGCDKIEYVLSVSVAKLLVNLQQIGLHECKQMEQVIKMDDEEGITKKTDKIVFPQLRMLYLQNNVGLKVFCQGNHHLEFPALENVLIHKCPNLNNFCSGSLSTQNLMSVNINKMFEDEKSIWMGDLNKTVQYIYQSSKKYVNEEEDEEGTYLEIIVL